MFVGQKQIIFLWNLACPSPMNFIRINLKCIQRRRRWASNEQLQRGKTLFLFCSLLRMNDTLSHWHCVCVCVCVCVFGSDITPHYLWNEGLHFLIQWSLWLEWNFMTTRISFTSHRAFSSLSLSVGLNLNKGNKVSGLKRMFLFSGISEFNGPSKIMLATLLSTAKRLSVNYRY